jgi:single-strand DNA-binding protein
MGRGLNKVMVIGNMGRDPEMRYTPAGIPVTPSCLASSRSWTTPSGERREETEWFNVVAWGGLAKICNDKLFKSQQVYVEGRLQTRSWGDEGGQRHHRTEIVASDMIILGPRDRNGSDNHQGNNHQIHSDHNSYPAENHRLQHTKEDM